MIHIPIDNAKVYISISAMLLCLKRCNYNNTIHNLSVIRMSAWLADVPVEQDQIDEFLEGTQDPAAVDEKVSS